MPHTTGVGQTVVVYAFLGNAPPPGSAETNTYRFHNYTVTFVAPSGKTDVKHYDTIFDTTGAQTIQFTPDEVGTYNITFVYGGQTLTVGGVDQPAMAYSKRWRHLSAKHCNHHTCCSTRPNSYLP